MVETRRQKKAARRCDAPPSLAEQPADVLLLVGACLADVLKPSHLASLASSCWAIRQALETAVAELREARLAVVAFILKVNSAHPVYSISRVFSGALPSACWGSRGLDHADAQLMARTLFDSGRPVMAALHTLGLSLNPLTDDGVATLAGAWAATPLAELRMLYLSETGMGDAGLRALLRALARGALPKLALLSIRGNHIGDEGVRALAAAASKGALPALQTLRLDGNRGIRDAAPLAAAIAGGALPSLTSLTAPALHLRPLQDACAARPGISVTEGPFGLFS